MFTWMMRIMDDVRLLRTVPWILSKTHWVTVILFSDFSGVCCFALSNGLLMLAVFH